MPTKTIRPLRATSNAVLADSIRNQASADYRSRIPLATQAGITETLRHLHDNRPLMNEFIDVLVNRIGKTVYRNKVWSNPLAQFKQGMLNYGDTIEEIQTGLLKAHIYDPDREYLEKDIFGNEPLPAEANFHKINRQNYYKMSVNEALLQRAFLEDGGLTSFIDGLMDAPLTSDNLDEFLATCQLIPEYEANGGFYHVRVGDIADWTSEGSEVRMALRKMRALADTLPFISTKYNAAHMPVFANKDELVLLASPEFQAAIDVEALAGAFNVSKADVYGRIVTIPQQYFGIDDVQAILTTENFFVIADTLIENRSMANPVSLTNNYFLHHHQIISASRFAPAIALTKMQDDESISVQTPVVTAVETPQIDELRDAITYMSTDDGDKISGAERGSTVALVAPVDMSPSENDDYSAVAWGVVGGASPSTFITQQGVLHVGASETATSVTVTATSVSIDPANPRALPKVASLVVPVTGDMAPNWPVRPVGDLDPSAGSTTAVLAVLEDSQGNTLVEIRNGATLSITTDSGTVKASDLAVETPQGTNAEVKVAGDGKSLTVTLTGASGSVDYPVTVSKA